MQDFSASVSLALCRSLLGTDVNVVIDRPLGSAHPKHGFRYEANYGYIPGVVAPDGEELDAYVLGVSEPLERFLGEAIAIVHRATDDDDKLIVVPKGMKISDEEIERLIAFQEQFFAHEIIR